MASEAGASGLESGGECGCAGLGREEAAEVKAPLFGLGGDEEDGELEVTVLQLETYTV